jgi:hypothetical protein
VIRTKHAEERVPVFSRERPKQCYMGRLWITFSEGSSRMNFPVTELKRTFSPQELAYRESKMGPYHVGCMLGLSLVSTAAHSQESKDPDLQKTPKVDII